MHGGRAVSTREWVGAAVDSGRAKAHLATGDDRALECRAGSLTEPAAEITGLHEPQVFAALASLGVRPDRLCARCFHASSRSAYAAAWPELDKPR